MKSSGAQWRKTSRSAIQLRWSCPGRCAVSPSRTVIRWSGNWAAEAWESFIWRAIRCSNATWPSRWWAPTFSVPKRSNASNARQKSLPKWIIPQSSAFMISGNRMDLCFLWCLSWPERVFDLSWKKNL